MTHAVIAATASQWLTKEEAAAILGCSERTIERKAEAGEIRGMMAKRRGKRDAALYEAADVERIRMEMEQSARGPAELAVTRPPDANPAALALERLATIGERLRGAVTARRWLTPEEASSDSGLSKRFLRRLAIDGKILAVKDGHQWKIASDALGAWQPENDRPAIPTR